MTLIAGAAATSKRDCVLRAYTIKVIGARLEYAITLLKKITNVRSNKCWHVGKDDPCSQGPGNQKMMD